MHERLKDNTVSLIIKNLIIPNEFIRNFMKNLKILFSYFFTFAFLFIYGFPFTYLAELENIGWFPVSTGGGPGNPRGRGCSPRNKGSRVESKQSNELRMGCK